MTGSIDPGDYWTKKIFETMPRISDRNLVKLRELVQEALEIEISEVEVVGSMIPTSTVEVYGLTITLDALGRAVTIRSEEGFIS